MPRSRASTALALVLVAVLAAACSGSRGDSSTTTSFPLITTSTEAEPTATPTTTPQPVAMPDTPAGDALQWLLDHAGTRLDPGAVVQHFDPQLLEEIPVEQISAIVEGLGPDHRVAEILHATDTELVAIVAFGPESSEIQLAVEPGEPHRIVALLLTPFVPAPAPPSRLDEVGPAWSALAPTATLLIAEIANGRCQPIVEVGADQYGPLGVTSALYVLGAVASAVEAGTIGWDDPVLLRDELRNPSSGTFHELPSGTVRTVEEHATAMIELGDSTATDHLIDLVGSEAVEQAVVELGHGTPGMNRSNPATGEWLASPNDLCHAVAVLEELSRWPGLEQLDAILAAPDALADGVDARLWLAGGPEPGGLNVTLLAIDGTTRILATGTLVDPGSTVVDHTGTIRWLTQVIGLLLG